MSHRILLFVALVLMILVSLAGWYYVDSLQQTTRTASQRTATDAPALTVPARKDIPADESTINATIKTDSTPPAVTQVRVNGQRIQTPQTGAVHKTIQNNDGTTTVDISVDANSSGTTTTRSSTSIELNSSSEVNSRSESSQ